MLLDLPKYHSFALTMMNSNKTKSQASMSVKNISQSSLASPQKHEQDQFYQLHYKPRRNSDLNNRQPKAPFRSNSITGAARQVEDEQARKQRERQAYLEARKEEERRIESLGRERKRNDKFSLKKMLSVEAQRGSLEGYYRTHKARGKMDMEQWSKKSLTVRLAVQRCEDEKAKVQKVMASDKQSDETKMDYLALKKRDLQRQIHNEITSIYDQFFRKDYEDVMGQEGRGEFENKLRVVMQLLRGGSNP